MVGLRKSFGYGMALIAFITLGGAIVVSAIVVAMTLLGIESNVNEIHLMPAISLLMVCLFERQAMARVVMRFEAFAQNIPLQEYENSRMIRQTQ